MPLRDRPIEQKIFLLVLPACLIPAAALLILMMLGSRASLEQILGDQLRQRAASLSEQFDQNLMALSERVRRAIAEDELAPGRVPADLTAMVEAVVRVNREGAPVLLTPPVAGSPIPDQLDRADNVFRLLHRYRARMLPTGSFFDLQLGEPGGIQPHTYGLLVHPTADGGFLVFLINARRLTEELGRRLLGLPENLIVLSDRGLLVYSTMPVSADLIDRLQRRLLREQAETGALDPFIVEDGGGNSLIASSPSKRLDQWRMQDGFGAGWNFLLEYDMAPFLGPLDALLWLSIVVSLVLVLLALGAAALASRRLVIPIKHLRRQAERLAQGDLDVRVSSSGRDEIGDLAAAFNAMAARLRGTYRTLEERAEESRRHAEHIHVANEMTHAIIQAYSLDSLFEILVRELGRVVPFDALWLTMNDRDGGDLNVIHIWPPGLIAHFPRGVIPLNRSLHGRAVRERETLHAEIGPAQRGEFHESRALADEGFQSFLIAPLPARDRVIGTLSIASTGPDAFDAELAGIVTSLAGVIAIAIEQGALFKRISQFATELERRVDDRTRELETATHKLIMAEKYFATGRLAGNLAHEINNPLGIIKNYLQLVRNNLRAAGGGRRRTDPNLQSIEAINEEVDRIARLVGRMLDLHRPAEDKVEPVDLNELIAEILTLMEPNLERSRIEVVRELAHELPRPIASRDLLRQVLINLIRNAQDAMEEGGRLLLRTSAISLWEEGEERLFVRVRVSDSGTGIAPEHLNRIFDPFFTTKSPDKGTGLGLCVSYSIVRMYGGNVDVESEPGRGATFIVTLPVNAPATADEGPPREALIHEIHPPAE